MFCTELITIRGVKLLAQVIQVCSEFSHAKRTRTYWTGILDSSFFLFSRSLSFFAIHLFWSCNLLVRLLSIVCPFCSLFAQSSSVDDAVLSECFGFPHWLSSSYINVIKYFERCINKERSFPVRALYNYRSVEYIFLNRLWEFLKSVTL